MAYLPLANATLDRSLRDLRKQRSAIDSLIRALNRYEQSRANQEQQETLLGKMKRGRMSASAWRPEKELPFLFIARASKAL